MILFRKKSLISLLLLSFFAELGCSSKAAQKGQETQAQENQKIRIVRFDPSILQKLGLRVDEAGSAAKDYEFSVTGTLDYDLEHYAEVGSIADGRVTNIRVRVGDSVKKGDVLATMMIPSIAQAQADFLAAEAAAHIGQSYAERESKLLDKELTTAREAEVAKGEALRTRAEFSAARAKLSALSATGRPALGAGALSLISPLEGVVVKRDAVLGRFMDARETAFVVANPKILRAEVNIFETDLPYVKVGSEAEIMVDAHPGLIVKGSVSHVDPSLGKSSRALRAQILVPNPDTILRAGEFVRASIKLPETKDPNHLYIPASSVQPLGEDDVVFVETSAGVFEVRTVQVVRGTAQVAEVQSGLRKGERIVVEGAFFLRGEVAKQ